MGRRNINTTKSGKYMNPTDQARKEARKKELKKNKRQRMMVRTAVLKGKDPTQLIIEMEKMDQMEYNVEIPPALSEKVLKDKRKKLRETLDRVLKLYEKENPEYWEEIRRMVADYEKKRQALIEYYEAVKHAQAVTVDEIPLPNLDMPSMPEDGMEHYDGIVLPPSNLMPHEHMMDGNVIPVQPPPQGILKKPFQQQFLQTELLLLPHQPLLAKVPPGCPPTLPPDLSDDEDEDERMDTDAPPKQRKIRFQDDPEDKVDSDEERHKSDDESLEHSAKKDELADDDSRNKNSESRPKSQGLTSLQAKLLQLSGQDVDQFVRETEVLLQEKEADKRAGLKERLSKLKDDDPSSKKSLRPTVHPSSALPVSTTSAAIVAPSIESSSLALTQTSTAPPPTIVAPPADTPMPVAPPTITMVPVPYNIPPVGVPPVGLPPVGIPPSVLSNLPMFRPPPPRPGIPPPPIGVRLPPGPPPQNLGQLLPHGPPRLPNMRLPPPMRPPGVPVPPGMLPRAPPPTGATPGLHNPAPNVLTAAPQLLPRPSRQTNAAGTATIQAKPQIRSLSADVTRFQPTVLRVKREDKKKTTKAATDGKDVHGRMEELEKKPTKDDAYSQFMREMEDLL